MARYLVEDTREGYRISLIPMLHVCSPLHSVDEVGGHGTLEKLFAETEKEWLRQVARQRREKYEKLAFDLGAIAAERAATWVIDGNKPKEHYERLVTMMDEGDPLVDEYLPMRPSLSGEWAGEVTPETLVEEVTGHQAENINHEVIEAILNAWERGVDERFQSACEAEARKMV